MKLRSRLCPQPLRVSISTAFAALAITLVASSVAATFTWDSDLGTPGAQDGSGTWDPSTATWINAGSNVAWANGNDATFGSGVDGSYAVSVALNPTANSLVFNNSGYTLSAATAQTITVSSATAAIVLGTGVTSTIGNNVTVVTPAAPQSSVISGAGTLVIDAGGIVKNAGTTSSNVININTATVQVKTGGLLTTSPIAGGGNGNAIFVNGTLNVDGGLVNAGGTLGVGMLNTGAPGVININTGTVLATSTNGIRIGSASAQTLGGTVNLNAGGTLQAFTIFRGNTLVTNGVLNLNGGTLQSFANTTTFISALTQANVRDGGAILDIGNAVTVPQILSHSNIGGDAAIDGGVTKKGNGTMIFSGLNTYNGGTRLNAGTVSVSSDSNLGDAAGALTFNGGTLQITGAAFTSTARTINWGASGGGFDINLAATNFGVSQSLTAGGALTKLGVGILTLSGTNTFTGGVNLNAGTLSVSGETNLGDASNALNFNGGILQITGTTMTSTARTINWGAFGGGFDVNNAGSTFTVSQSLLGGGGLTKNGAGTLVLPSANSYTGTTNINGGALRLTDSGALGTSTLSAGTTIQLQLANNITIHNTIRLTGGGPNFDGEVKNLSGDNTLTDFGVVLATGLRFNIVSGSSLRVTNNLVLAPGGSPQSIRVIGSGIFQLDGDSSAVLANTAQSFLIGDGTVAGPVIKAGNDLTFGGSIINFQAASSSTLQSVDATPHTFGNSVVLTATATTFGATGTGDLTFNGAATLGADATVTVNNAHTTFNNGVQETGGPHSLTKAGNGTLVLGGSNGYTGSTTVSAGTLIVNGSLSGTIATVATGATLGGTGFFSPSIAVAGTLSPGNTAASVGQMNITSSDAIGALDLSNGTYRWELGSLTDGITGLPGTDFDQITLSGPSANLTLGGNSTLALGFDNGIADPNSSDPFWSTNHSWAIITAGSGSNLGSSQFSFLTNANFAHGFFTTSADAFGDVTLSFTAVPEPTSALLLLGGLAMLTRRRSRKP